MKFLSRFLHITVLCVLITLCISMTSTISIGQNTDLNLINNGYNIVISNGAYLNIGKDYINRTAYNDDGKVDIDGRMVVKGDWINDAKGNNVFVNIEPVPDGEVIMDGLLAQTIKGSNTTTFENIRISNSEKTLGITDNKVKGILTVEAILNLNTKRIIIDNNSSKAITYKSKYILSETTPNEGYGEVQWNIGDILSSYTIPFGSGAGGNDLNLTVTTTSSGHSTDGNITFATYPTDWINEPLPIGVTKFVERAEYMVDRYWIIDPDYSISKPDLDIDFTYASKDINPLYNSPLVPELLKGESFCKDCGNDWKTVGASSASEKRVTVTGVSGKDCYAPWRLISEEEEPTIFFPNAFTPQDDNLNDNFGPIGEKLDVLKNYKLIIYDRWGGIVFMTDNVYGKWDGKLKPSGKIAPDGVYVWAANYNDDRGFYLYKTGRVTVLKNTGDK
jgi:gliding motility-associated-like protein